MLPETTCYKGYVKSHIDVAAQPSANARVLTAVNVLVRPQRAQRDFHDLVEPMLDQREILQLPNYKLPTVCDLLLPLLMSGELLV